MEAARVRRRGLLMQDPAYRETLIEQARKEGKPIPSADVGASSGGRVTVQLGRTEPGTARVNPPVGVGRVVGAARGTTLEGQVPPPPMPSQMNARTDTGETAEEEEARRQRAEKLKEDAARTLGDRARFFDAKAAAKSAASHKAAAKPAAPLTAATTTPRGGSPAGEDDALKVSGSTSAAAIKDGASKGGERAEAGEKRASEVKSEVKSEADVPSKETAGQEAEADTGKEPVKQEWKEVAEQRLREQKEAAERRIREMLGGVGKPKASPAADSRPAGSAAPAVARPRSFLDVIPRVPAAAPAPEDLTELAVVRPAASGPVTWKVIAPKGVAVFVGPGEDYGVVGRLLSMQIVAAQPAALAGWLELAGEAGFVRTHAGRKGVMVRQGKQLGFGGREMEERWGPDITQRGANDESG